MTTNKLKLNDSKTEIIVFNHHGKSLDLQNICIGDSSIECTTVVRNLGVYFDSSMSMTSHINKVSQAAHFHLRNIGKIRHLIDDNTCKLLVNSLITSRLDYCNSLLHGVNKTTIARLQKIQNKAARIVTRCNKYEHITPVLKSLHWLPIEQRIVYKILLLTYKSLHDEVPAHLSELLPIHVSCRQLRSSQSVTLKQVKSKSKFSERAFSVCAPALWNTLSVDTRSCTTINTFKSSLKTELFRRAFGP